MLFFLLIYTPMVVFAWRISAVAGVVATAVLVFIGLLGSRAYRPR